MAKQMNLQVTPDFERDLREIMRAKGLKSRSEAVRRVVREAAEATPRLTMGEWMESAWGLAAEGASPPFDDDELWAGTDPDIADPLDAADEASPVKDAP